MRDKPIIRTLEKQILNRFVGVSLVVIGIYAVRSSDLDTKEIIISTYQEDHMAILSIANTGDHIPDNLHGQIFDPFFTTNEPQKGTGLGLFISYKLVAEHNGKIRAENISGEFASL